MMIKPLISEFGSGSFFSDPYPNIVRKNEHADRMKSGSAILSYTNMYSKVHLSPDIKFTGHPVSLVKSRISGLPGEELDIRLPL